jgi:hypothetical protein
MRDVYSPFVAEPIDFQGVDYPYSRRTKSPKIGQCSGEGIWEVAVLNSDKPCHVVVMYLRRTTRTHNPREGDNARPMVVQN